MVRPASVLGSESQSLITRNANRLVRSRRAKCLSSISQPQIGRSGDLAIGRSGDREIGRSGDRANKNHIRWICSLFAPFTDHLISTSRSPDFPILLLSRSPDPPISRSSCSPDPYRWLATRPFSLISQRRQRLASSTASVGVSGSTASVKFFTRSLGGSGWG